MDCTIGKTIPMPNNSAKLETMVNKKITNEKLKFSLITNKRLL